MAQPERLPPLLQARRGIIAIIALCVLVTIAVSVHRGYLADDFAVIVGVMLGALAGTYIGVYLTRYAERISATTAAWFQMAGIVIMTVGFITYRSLPAYCQLPVGFAMGVCIVTAYVFIRQLRMRTN
jgi:hypothetical protein